MKAWKKALCLCVALCMLFTFLCPALPARAFEPETPVECPSAYVLNLETGTVVYQKGADEQRDVATLTQIVTAALVLRNYDKVKDAQITIPSWINNTLYGRNGVYTADIRAGETLSGENLLYALFIQNSMEAAYALAEYLGDGDVAAFVQMMNDYAAEAGATNTVFKNPAGLYEEGQYSTVADMAKIIVKAMEEDERFLEMSNTYSYALPATEKTGQRVLAQLNYLINSTTSYYVSSANGIKAGWNNNSGRCVATLGIKNGYNYLIVLAGGQVYNESGGYLSQNVALVDAKNLLDWAFSSFTVQQIAKAGDPITEVPLRYSLASDHLSLAPNMDFYALLPTGADETTVQKVFEVPESVNAPVSLGQEVGTLVFKLADEEIGRVTLVACDEAGLSQGVFLLDFITSLFTSVWFLVILAVVLILILLLWFFAATRRRAKNRYKVKRHSRF